MSTSAKRRRTSPTTYVPISDEETQTSRLDKNITPKRHSYRSPTKSSLARSHPRVLQQTQEAKERRESVPNRRQSLLDAVMNNKPLFFPQSEHSKQSQPSVTDRAPGPVNRAPATPRASNVVTDMASVFRDIEPRASSSRPTPSEFVVPEVQPEIPTPRRRWVSPVASPRIVPKLVKSASKIAAERARRSSSVELPPTPVQLGKDPVPERPRGLLTSSPGGGGRRRDRARGGAITSSPLKPRNVARTPPVPLEVDDEDVVQMEVASGIGDEDERTTGEEEELGELVLDLSQSEGEHTTAEQNEEEQPENETPTQLADTEMHLPEEDPPEESEHESPGIDQEADPEVPEQLEHTRTDREEQAEVEMGVLPDPYQPQDMPAESGEQATHANNNLARHKYVEPNDIADEGDDPVIQGKIEELKALQAQLAALRADCSRIEAFSKDLHQTTTQEPFDQAAEEGLELLLDALPVAPSTWPVPLEDAPIFRKQVSKYLNLFAPSSLQLFHSTRGQTIGNIQYATHQIVFTIPTPWPASILKVNLETTMDTSCDVLAIVLNKDDQIPHVLRKWIESRINDPLLKCDLATIATGIGHYFQEDVKRAKVFQYLQNIQDLSSNTDATMPHLDNVVSNIEEATALLPYLNTSSYSFALRPKPQQEPRTRQSLSSTQQIMLKYTITLNWIGQPAIETDVCPVGFSVDTVKHTKKLFRQVQEIEGVVAAFQKVCELLGVGTMGEREKGRIGKGKARVRRMTVFD